MKGKSTMNSEKQTETGKNLTGIVIREDIKLSEFEIFGKCRSKYDAVVKYKYPNAKSIIPLKRSKNLKGFKSAMDLLMLPGILYLLDSIKDRSAYYLVETENNKLLVNVTKKYIESSQLRCDFTEGQKVIGENLFLKTTYIL